MFNSQQTSRRREPSFWQTRCTSLNLDIKTTQQQRLPAVNLPEKTICHSLLQSSRVCANGTAVNRATTKPSGVSICVVQEKRCGGIDSLRFYPLP
jgi:hypothetical protein